MEKFNKCLKVFTILGVLTIALFYSYNIFNSSNNKEFTDAKKSLLPIIVNEIKNQLNTNSEIEIPFYNEDAIMQMNRKKVDNFFYLELNFEIIAEFDLSYIVKDTGDTGVVKGKYIINQGEDWQVVNLYINGELVKIGEVFKK